MKFVDKVNKLCWKLLDYLSTLADVLVEQVLNAHFDPKQLHKRFH